MDLFDYDAELRLHNAHLRAAARVGAGDRVLDIGCGTGQTTRQAARAAVEGSAVGVDNSKVMLERARRISADEGPPNVDFVLADAQVNAFPPPAFDLCISRFGVMFFADPLAAFTNIARARCVQEVVSPGLSGKATTATNGQPYSATSLPRLSPPLRAVPSRSATGLPLNHW